MSHIQNTNFYDNLEAWVEEERERQKKLREDLLRDEALLRSAEKSLDYLKRGEQTKALDELYDHAELPF